MLALILALLGIIVGFFILEVGFILEIVAIFVARNQMKKNEKYAKSAYYISLIAAVLQLIIFVVSIVLAITNTTNIVNNANDEVNDIKNRHETVMEYIDKCNDKYNNPTDYNKCSDAVDACFETYDDLDKAKKCADDIFK